MNARNPSAGPGTSRRKKSSIGNPIAAAFSSCMAMASAKTMQFALVSAEPPTVAVCFQHGMQRFPHAKQVWHSGSAV
jgi:hypothetical protein